ncbi:MAG: extracellular solute-binding protein family 1, partial [Herbinix sp.]|nr:extracellular solute-binding protein family 1 [Herbinix sp.]
MKKIMFRKLTAVTCMMAMTFVMFTACQKSDTVKNTTSVSEGEEKTEKVESSKPIKLHILNRVNADVVVEDNPIIKELENKLNVDITYEAPPINNYNEKLQIAMAAGDIPDIIYNWGGSDTNYEQWAGDGLLAELDDK